MSEQESKPVVISSSLDHVIAESTADAKNMRLGIVAAVAAHVVLFAINWPSIAGPPPDHDQKQAPIIRLQPYKFEAPTPPPPQTQIRPPARPIPVPGPPDEPPEPIRDESMDDIIYDPQAISTDIPIPDAPPEIEPAVRLVGPEVKPPKRIVTVNPIYPEIARRAHKEGIVVLSLIIGEDGRVQSVDVQRGLPLGLTEAAVDAARQWVFEPSTYRGRPTAVQYILTVQFHLD